MICCEKGLLAVLIFRDVVDPTRAPAAGRPAVGARRMVERCVCGWRHRFWKRSATML